MTAKPEPVLDLDPIRARVDAATPGPWCSCPVGDPRTLIAALIAEVERLRAELSRMCEPPF